MNAQEIQKALAAFFRADQVRARPGVLSGDKQKALVVWYVPPEHVQQRLDDVLGVDGWQSECEVTEGGCVVTRLTVWVDGRAVTRTDAGAPSKQPDPGDRLKAAFTQGLKRAAGLFGVGRYLKNVPATWAELDQSGKRFKAAPKLPAAFLPPPVSAPTPPPPEPPAPAPKAPPPERRPAAKAPAAPATLPATGEELRARLQLRDAQLAAQGRCRPGELVEHVAAGGARAGHGKELQQWGPAGIALAADLARRFEQDHQTVKAAARPGKGRVA